MHSSRHHRGAAGLALAAILLSSCSGGGADADAAPSPVAAIPAPSPTPEPSPSPSPTAIDASTVPDTIDVAYVQAVMDELVTVIQAGYDGVGAEGRVTEEFAVAMHSTHTTEQAARNIRGFERIGGPDALADPVGRITADVQELVFADAECIEAEVVYDLTPLLRPDVDFEPEQPYTVKLVRADPDDFSPTPWVIAFNSWYLLEEPCHA